MSTFLGIAFLFVIYATVLLLPLAAPTFLLCIAVLFLGDQKPEAFRRRWKKHKKLIVASLVPIFVLSVFTIWLYCYRSFPNRHYLIHANSSSAAIVKNHRVIVDAHVLEQTLVRDGFFVHGELQDGRRFTLNTRDSSVIYSSRRPTAAARNDATQ